MHVFLLATPYAFLPTPAPMIYGNNGKYVFTGYSISAIYSSAMKKITIEISDENHMAVLSAQLVAKQVKLAETSVSSVIDAVLTQWRNKEKLVGMSKGTLPDVLEVLKEIKRQDESDAPVAQIQGQVITTNPPKYMPDAPLAMARINAKPIPKTK
jgi:hypothetical protein